MAFLFRWLMRAVIALAALALGASLLAYYLAGQSLPDYKLLNLRYTERFTPQDMKDLKPLPSGILGAVKLVSR